MNIVLIGYRCSGKSSVGRSLATELQRAFVDTDAMVEERAGRSIREIVVHDGWSRFRELEKRAVQEATALDNRVISTGGGVVAEEVNRAALKLNGWVVWLRAGADIIRSRMSHDKGRPTLTAGDPMEEVDEVLKLRTPLYERTADETVDTGFLTIRQVVETLLRKLPVEEA
ncbi:MAG: shikimate kinase [Thermodesulfobacteriota bacterium]